MKKEKEKRATAEEKNCEGREYKEQKKTLRRDSKTWKSAIVLMGLVLIVPFNTFS